MVGLHSRCQVLALLKVFVPTITVRNIPEETHRALRVRAALAGRSTEAEVLAILESATRPQTRIKLGTLLADISREAGGLDLDIVRDKTPSEPLRFEKLGSGSN